MEQLNLTSEDYKNATTVTIRIYSDIISEYLNAKSSIKTVDHRYKFIKIINDSSQAFKKFYEQFEFMVDVMVHVNLYSIKVFTKYVNELTPANSWKTLKDDMYFISMSKFYNMIIAHTRRSRHSGLRPELPRNPKEFYAKLEEEAKIRIIEDHREEVLIVVEVYKKILMMYKKSKGRIKTTQDKQDFMKRMLIKFKMFCEKFAFTINLMVYEGMFSVKLFTKFMTNLSIENTWENTSDENYSKSMGEFYRLLVLNINPTMDVKKLDVLVKGMVTEISESDQFYIKFKELTEKKLKLKHEINDNILLSEFMDLIDKIE